MLVSHLSLGIVGRIERYRGAFSPLPSLSHASLSSVSLWKMSGSKISQLRGSFGFYRVKVILNLTDTGNRSTELQGAATGIHALLCADWLKVFVSGFVVVVVVKTSLAKWLQMFLFGLAVSCNLLSLQVWRDHTWKDVSLFVCFVLIFNTSCAKWLKMFLVGLVVSCNLLSLQVCLR